MTEVSVVRSNFFEKAVQYAAPATAGEGTHVLAIQDGEVFEARGDTDMTEGRGARYRVGLYMNLAHAVEAAKGKGAQGGFGYVSIVGPVTTPVFAFDEDHNPVQIGTSTMFQPIKWEDRLTELR